MSEYDRAAQHNAVAWPKPSMAHAIPGACLLHYWRLLDDTCAPHNQPSFLARVEIPEYDNVCTRNRTYLLHLFGDGVSRVRGRETLGKWSGLAYATIHGWWYGRHTPSQDSRKWMRLTAEKCGKLPTAISGPATECTKPNCFGMAMAPKKWCEPHLEKQRVASKKHYHRRKRARGG